MIITEHQWELSHDFRGVAMTLLDGCLCLFVMISFGLNIFDIALRNYSPWVEPFGF